MKLFYYITSLSICQVLFSSFFKSFQDVRYCLSYSNFYSISLLFKFVKYFFKFFSNFLFCDTFASACFFQVRQPSYYITFKQVCQYLFQSFFKLPSAFFPLVRTSSLNSRFSLPRSTALLLYHFLTGLSRKILNGLFLFFCECFTNSPEHIILFGAISFLFFNCMQQKLPPIKPHMSTIFRLAHKLVKQLHFGY